MVDPKSKLKVFVYDKLKTIQMTKFVLDDIENIVGKEKNAGYQHFLLFPKCFQKAITSGSLKVGFSGKGLNGKSLECKIRYFTLKIQYNLYSATTQGK